MMKINFLLLICFVLLFSGCEKVTVDRSEFDMETPFVPKFDKDGKRIEGESLYAKGGSNLRPLRRTDIADQLKPEEEPLFRSIAEKLEARKFAEIKKTLEIYLADNPGGEGLYRAYYLKTRCEYELGLFDEAKITIQTAYKKSPANPYSVDLLRLLVEVRKKESALKKQQEKLKP